MVQHFKQNFDYEFLRKTNGKGRILSDEEYECCFLKINVKDVFQQHVNSKFLVVDIINLVDKYVKYNKFQQLKQFIFDYDNQPSSWDFYQEYNRVIHVAIKCNDIEYIEFLWGKDNFYGGSADYTDGLYYACEYGNLITCQHILYTYCNCGFIELNGYASIKKMKNLASLNSDKSVKLFIDCLFDGISEILEDGDTFYGCHNEKIEDCQSELATLDPNDEEYIYEQNELKFATLYFNNLNKFIHQ